MYGSQFVFGFVSFFLFVTVSFNGKATSHTVNELSTKYDNTILLSQNGATKTAVLIVD